VLVALAVVNAQTVHRYAPPLPLGEAVRLTVAGVAATSYVVTADLVVRNDGADEVTVLDFATTGVAISARGGLPERVPGRSSRTLSLHLEIPRCEGVPGRFGGFALAVRRGSELVEVPYISEPGTPLYAEMAALTDRICAAYRSR
jgi:hypothetical protein